MTVSGSAGGPYTVTFASGVADYEPQAITASIASLTGTYKVVNISPSAYVSKGMAISNCTGVSMRNNQRPTANFANTLTSVAFIDTSDVWVTDTSPHFQIGLKPTIYDSFTDADTTAIASHVPEVGGITWQETSGPDATILTNRLKIATNGNVVYTDLNTNNWTVEFSLYAFADTTQEYSFVFDYDDANNHTALKFVGSEKKIVLVETVASTPTTLATYSAWMYQSVEHRFLVQCVGKYVTVSMGDTEILRGTLTSLGSTGIVGFRKDVGNGSADSAFSAVAISY